MGELLDRLKKKQDTGALKGALGDKLRAKQAAKKSETTPTANAETGAISETSTYRTAPTINAASTLQTGEVPRGLNRFAPQQPIVTGGQQMARIDRERADIDAKADIWLRGDIDQLAGLSYEEKNKVRRAAMAKIPEITGSLSRLSEKITPGHAMAALTMFDPNEMGKMLSSVDPAIGIITTPEGETLAVNRDTNAVLSLNKPGVSKLDLLQAGGAAAMFTPAGRLSSLGGQALAAAGTQAGIETMQSAVGGEFNPADVAIAGAAGPALALAGKGFTAIKTALAKNAQMIDQATGLPVPAFEKALKKRGIDYGALIDDADNLPVIQTKKSADELADEIIKEHLRLGKKSEFVHKFRLKGDRIIEDDLGIEAVRQGFRAGDIAQAKQMNDATRRQAIKMLNMQRAIKANTARAQEFRPTDVVGDAAIQRVRALDGKASSLRAELNSIAAKELRGAPGTLPSPDKISGKAINLDRVEGSFKSLLDDMNVNYKTGPDAPPLFEQIKQKGFFEGSDIMEDKSSQGVIRSVTNLLASPGRNDAWRAHKVKTQIDKMIDYKKTSMRGLTQTGQRFAKAMRSTLNDEIRAVSPKYAKVNDQLSSILTAFDDLQSAVGPNVKLFEADANRQLGQVFRKLWSKDQKRGVFQSAVDQLEDTASNLGMKFNTNAKDLSQFAVTLEDTFGDVARTGFKAEVASGVNLATDPKMAALKYAGEKVGEQVAKFRNINDTERFNVMTKILKRGQ